jgi:3D (Asp-Asp-Asp) domain-containing protein
MQTHIPLTSPALPRFPIPPAAFPHSAIRTLARRASAAMAALVLLGTAPTGGADGLDTWWTDRDGVTVRARLVACTDTHVFLQQNGVDHRVPLDLLSDASRAKVARLLDGPPSRPAPAVGPVLRSSAAGRSFAAVRPAAATRTLQVPPPVPRHRVASSSGLARDRHGMPLYPFSSAVRIVRTTAYTSTESDHLIYGDRSALGTRLRCSGALRSAAADWSVYPVGTIFRIKGSAQLYQVDDYGSALVGTGTIDIYQPTMAAMQAWGRRNVEITVVRWGSLTRSAQILSRRAGSAHCQRMLCRIIRERPALGCLARR